MDEKKMRVALNATQRVPISKLKPAAYNPREISDAAERGLRESLRKFGLVQPIVWNKRTGNVVGGHQLLKVLIADGAKEVDVVQVDLAPDDEKALNLTLNNPKIQGEFTAAALGMIEDLEKIVPDASDSLLLSALKGSLVRKPDETKEAFEEREKVLAEMELQPFEHYDYLLAVSNNKHDWDWLVDNLGIERVDGTVYFSDQASVPTKHRKIGLGRAIPAAKLIAKLKAARGEGEHGNGKKNPAPARRKAPRKAAGRADNPGPAQPDPA